MGVREGRSQGGEPEAHIMSESCSYVVSQGHWLLCLAMEELTVTFDCDL